MEIVNGFVCTTCTDVENARKMIDPAHPKAGPINQQPLDDVTRGPAVVLGGALAGGGPTTAERDAAVFRPYGPDARR